MSTDIVETEELIKATGVGVLPDDGHVINLAERRSQLIPIRQIAPPKKDQWSLFNKKAAQEIADTIKAKGLMVPILLRPLPKSPTEVTSNGTQYEIVAGRQRFYACGTILKWESIPAIVQPMDDDDCKMYMLIENCARKTLGQDQLYAHINAWRKAHAAKVGAPDPMDLRRGRKEAATKARAAKKGSKPSDTQEAATEPSRHLSDPTGAVDLPGPAGARATNLQQAIAHATGTSVSTAKRTMRVAAMVDGLTYEEREVIFSGDKDKDPTKEQLEHLADLTTNPKPGQTGLKDVLKLASSGMPWDEAISLGNKRPGRKPDLEKPASIDDLDDDEWLEATCQSRIIQLKKTANFKSDALLYRKFVKLRKKIQADMETLLKATKAVGHRGPFHLWLERAFRINFPNEWKICGMCGGTGKSKVNGDSGDTPSCNTCYGAGYRCTVGEL